MTDFEVLMAFNEMAINGQDAYMNFVSIVFGFIVAGYLIADKLNRKMTIILTLLFTVVAFQEAMSAMLFLQDQVGLIPEMQTRKALQFHGASRVGDFAAPLLIATHVATQILAYVGSMIFFFHQRHEGLKKS